ncbi:MAG: helix-hairpin-helix domain-containing protein [Oscillospiraceae bacterium]|nr:helix-hairpin-helix domain-containing protein [Oscillospiraceae bacterium]
MLLKKIPFPALIAAAAIVVFLLGFFVGRWFGGGLIAVPNRSAADTEAVVPADDAEPIDLNTATAEELSQLPGIGEKIASDIVRYREENGPFQSVWEIRNVKGIGESKCEKLVPFLTVTQ